MKAVCPLQLLGSQCAGSLLLCPQSARIQIFPSLALRSDPESTGAPQSCCAASYVNRIKKKRKDLQQSLKSIGNPQNKAR